MRPRIYVAGPYTVGDTETNVAKAIDVGEQISQMGCDPYIPHLNHYRHLRYPHDYEFWMAEDLRWLAVCDAVYRMPGESPGADREVAEAVRRNKPVFCDFEALGDWIAKIKAPQVQGKVEG